MVRFYSGQSIPDSNTLPEGGIYFNTLNHIIYVNNRGTIEEYNGNYHTDDELNATYSLKDDVTLSLSGKADKSELESYATKDEVNSYIDSVLAQKTQVQIIIWEDTD